MNRRDLLALAFGSLLVAPSRADKSTVRHDVDFEFPILPETLKVGQWRRYLVAAIAAEHLLKTGKIKDGRAAYFKNGNLLRISTHTAEYEIMFYCGYLLKNLADRVLGHKPSKSNLNRLYLSCRREALALL